MNKFKIVLAVFSVYACVCGKVFADGGTDDDYSGVYKEYQLVPNKMTELCKKSADDMVNNPNSIADCINALALKRRSTEAETSREGLKELKQIEAEQVVRNIGVATAKGAAVAEFFAKSSEEVAESNKDASTVSDSDGAANQANATLTSVVNSMRDLYVEKLKYLAISNIESIEKDTLETIASTETLQEAAANEAAKNEDQGGSGGSSTGGAEEGGNGGSETSSSEPEVPTIKDEKPSETVVYKGDGVCQICKHGKGGMYVCKQQTCPDGTHPDSKDKNIGYVCQGGKCEKVDIRTEEAEVEEEEPAVEINKSIVFHRANGSGWHVVEGECEYCTLRGDGAVDCEERECPEGNFYDASDTSVIVSCKAGACVLKNN